MSFPPFSNLALVGPTKWRSTGASDATGRTSRSNVSLKQIAAYTGRALATVSYALRGSPKIPEVTREEIRRAADTLGYRPNPRISGLMTYIRRNQQRPFGEKIAFVWVHTSRAMARLDPFLRAVYLGAKLRAKQSGFGLEEFYTNDPDMTDGRLEQIIIARGITGVVLSPLTTNEAVGDLKWNWSHFSPAVIGNVSWTSELHQAGHHHYLGMRTALSELAKYGCVRPAAIIEQESNVRSKRAWEAAFLTQHSPEIQVMPLLAIPGVHDHPLLAQWVEKVRPDALIVSATSLLNSPGLRAVCRRMHLKVATLYWTPEAKGLGGIDQCYDRIAAHAVDLVIAQLNSNETGVPDLPRMILFPGRWVPIEGNTKRLVPNSKRSLNHAPTGIANLIAY